MKPIILLSLLILLAEQVEARELVEPPQRARRGRVALPVMLDSLDVYLAFGADSTAARTEVGRVSNILAELRAKADHPEAIRLRERDGHGIILVDSLEVLIVRSENRINMELSPLANALALREQVLMMAPKHGAAVWDEEELVLRLLLGIVYPVSLLVVLRLTRLGILRWERNWRSAALQWLARLAELRGLSEEDIRSRKIVNFLTGIERLVFYGAVFLLISFTWFALFPQTQRLATELLGRIIGPALDLIGGTARGVLLLGYSVVVVVLAYWVTRHLSERRRLTLAPGMLADPVVYFPLRIGVWIVALFLILFPYPGAPRLFAVGVLLIALLGALIAMRPLIEEIAAGIYINGTHALKAGDRLTVNGAPYVVVTPGLIHLLVMHGKQKHWIPYSRILKADMSLARLTKGHR